MVLKLNSVTGKNRFCGPAALSTLAGITTDDASRLIRRFSGKASTMGVHSIHLIKAIRASGLTVGGRRSVFENVTVNQWANAMSPGCYLVTVTHHYMVVRITKTTKTMVDSMNREPISLKEAKGSRRRVKAYRRIGD